MSRAWREKPRRRFYPRQRRSLARKLLDYVLTIVLLGLLAVLAARLDRIATRTEQGTATVNDGDTITLGQERIRLRGIDAPEYTQTCQRNGTDYACGRMARQALIGLIGGRAVSCTGWQRDRYGRLLGDCRAGDVDLNRALVAAGWAVAYGGYEAEERKARTAKVGLWAGSFDQPQDWRRAHGGQRESRHDTLGSLGDGSGNCFACTEVLL
jgi:endonuclease YncB( thermonuclease family)